MKIKKYLALVLCVVLCVQILPVMTFATETEYSISGNGVKVTFDGEELTLHRLDGTTSVQMSKPSAMGYPVVDGQAIQDFVVSSCVVDENATGVMGAGERMTITSTSSSTGLTRVYTLETADSVESVVYTTTTYQATNQSVDVDEFVDNIFELQDVEDQVWSYNGGGEGPTHVGDTLLKIDLTDDETFFRENIQDYRCASIPVADIYSAAGGITIGDASETRREVRTPVQETSDSVSVYIKWPGKTVAATAVAAGECFITVHSGDYYCGLRGYANAMTTIGMEMIAAEDIPDSSYDLRWESWGWEFDWTVDLIIGKLDELEAAGIKQITVDDGWYDSAGDWGLNEEKFPDGDADMVRLVEAIHNHGMTAILWWRPCDGGQDDSTLYQEHPEYFVQNEDGSTGKLDGAGQFGNFFYGTGYALCPGSEGAVAVHVEFINKAMNVWGFDGFKGDYVWSMPKCYNAAHNHAYPEESTEKQTEFYRAAREAMLANDPESFNLLCNCGVPQDYYGLQYLTQVATADPTSLDQTRRRVKAYKALIGDYFPVTTDHNSIWYPSAVGTGSVLIEKRNFTGTDQEEYERWLSIADTVQLHKGQFIGNLYSYGFDPYETYVVQKDGVMYYGFYRDGSKYAPTGYPTIELKGLDPEKMYRIVDYVNDEVVATNLMGDEAEFYYEFSSYLLVKAVEITTPDPETPTIEYISVDDRDSQLVYTGAWNDDSNTSFHESTARYTSTAGASVEYTFTGSAIRWYGQKDTNFGSAEVYLDNVLVETINVNGTMASGVVLYENDNLDYGTHTIKIVCASPTVDIDRFAYGGVAEEMEYTVVEETAASVTYGGTWVLEQNTVFSAGSAKYSSVADSYVEFTFSGTAVRWYGQNDTNFGEADVYIDNVLVGTVNVNGAAVVGKKLFEAEGLEDGVHVLKIVCKTPVIDVDHFEYAG